MTCQDFRIRLTQTQLAPILIVKSRAAHGRCVRARVALERSRATGSRAEIHVPFRAHKLTQLLKECFTRCAEPAPKSWASGPEDSLVHTPSEWV